MRSLQPLVSDGVTFLCNLQCPYTRGEVGWEWWGYSSPFDGPTTNTSPALASDGTKLYLAWKGDGTDGVQIRDSDDQGKTWGPPTPLGAMTKAGTGPRLVFFKGEFYMAFVGLEDNRIKVKRSANGTDWGDSSQIDTGETSDFEPSLTVFQDALYMAYRVAGGSNKIRIISSEYGRSWNEPVELPSEFRSRVAPALCALPGNEPVVKSTLFLAFQTTDRPQFIRVYTSTDGTTFGNGVTATVNHSPREGPALSALGNGRMYMVFPTTDYGPDFPEGDVIPRAKGAPPADQGESTADGGRVGPLMYLSSGADNNWSRSGPRFLPEGMLGDSCTDQTPSLVEFGPLDDDWPKGGLLMAFKGVGGKVLNMVRMGRALVY